MKKLITSLGSSLLLGAVLCCLAGRANARDGQPPHADASQDAASLENFRQRLTAQPAEAEAIAEFEAAVRSRFAAARLVSAAEAKKVVAEAAGMLGRVDARSTEAKEKLAALLEQVAFYHRWLAASDAKVDVLEARLLEDPDDLENFLLYELRFQLEDDVLVKSARFAEAIEQLNRAAHVLDAARSKTTNENIAEECDILLERIEFIHKPGVEEAKARWALVGTAATFPSSDAGAWINGSRPRAADFAGKVVLIDFWSLACAPCIAGFPKVQAWHEKYAAEGLTIVAAAPRAEGDANEAVRQRNVIEALFRERKLGFRCLTEDDFLWSAYAVEDVPFYVLIDRAGVIRRVLSGNNPKVFDEMQAEIVTLLAQPAP